MVTTVLDKINIVSAKILGSPFLKFAGKPLNSFYHDEIFPDFVLRFNSLSSLKTVGHAPFANSCAWTFTQLVCGNDAMNEGLSGDFLWLELNESLVGN